MSINFYKNILLLSFCLILLGPINLQAYCQYQDCGDSSNLEEAPLTLQEAQDIKEFYTAVERDLSENTEVLPDGTYRVNFSEDVKILGAGAFGIWGMSREPLSVVLARARAMSGPDVFDALSLKGVSTYKHKWPWKRFEENTDTLKNYFSDKHHVNIKEIIQEWSGKIAIDVDSPSGKHGILIKMGYERDYPYIQDTYITYYRKVGRGWVKADQYLVLSHFDGKEEYLRELDHVVKSLQSNNPQVFENYLKAQNIKFTGAVIRRRIANGFKFVGRWTARALLATAGIVGGYLAYDYAQENHPEETDLVINITKEQWEILSTNVREIIKDISEHNSLNELGL